MTNKDRIEIAKTALMTMPPEYGIGEEEAAITDLITNLLHVAREAGFDPFAIARMAVTHYEEEETEQCDGPEFGDGPEFAGWEERSQGAGGILPQSTICETCGGSGKVHSHNPKCWDCNGTGFTS